MFKICSKVYSSFFIFMIMLSCLFIPIIFTYKNMDSAGNITNSDFIICLDDFIWPIPGYTKISSYFGNRQSPTLGASSYHSGLDIPAPEGTPIYAIDDGIISFASWGAGGGYTITMSLDKYTDISVSYCHLSPVMYVKVGDFVEKNDKIATVGPKNVYGVTNNPYRDSNGNPTNGATTGCHLHFTIKKNSSAVDPLNYYILE